MGSNINEHDIVFFTSLQRILQFRTNHADRLFGLQFADIYPLVGQSIGVLFNLQFGDIAWSAAKGRAASSA